MVLYVLVHGMEEHLAEAPGARFPTSDFRKLVKNVDFLEGDAKTSDQSDSSVCI
jgi:hypothetical protein